MPAAGFPGIRQFLVQDAGQLMGVAVAVPVARFSCDATPPPG